MNSLSRTLITAGVLVVSCSVCTATPARADSSQAGAEQAVAAAYTPFQARCTPRMPPRFQSISWTAFTPGGNGSGRIIDANPALGGPFSVKYDPAAAGQWDVSFEFC